MLTRTPESKPGAETARGYCKGELRAIDLEAGVGKEDRPLEVVKSVGKNHVSDCKPFKLTSLADSLALGTVSLANLGVVL